MMNYIKEYFPYMCSHLPPDLLGQIPGRVCWRHPCDVTPAHGVPASGQLLQAAFSLLSHTLPTLPLSLGRDFSDRILRLLKILNLLCVTNIKNCFICHLFEASFISNMGCSFVLRGIWIGNLRRFPWVRCVISLWSLALVPDCHSTSPVHD